MWEKVILDNMSLGGARVRTLTRLPARSKIDLLMHLGSGRELEVRALVVYARSEKSGYQSEYGLRFIDLSYDRYQALIAYINDREKSLTVGVQHPRETRLA